MIYTPDIVWLYLVAAMEKYFYRCKIEDGHCPNCGKTTYDWKAGSKRKKFCSERCRLEYKYRRPHPISEKTTQVRICPVCQNYFLTYKDETLAQEFCSAECRNTYQHCVAVDDDEELEGQDELQTNDPTSDGPIPQKQESNPCD